MKRLSFIAACLLVVSFAGAQVFTQNFEKSGKIRDYVAKKPDNGQFNVIGATEEAKVAVVNGKLQLSRTAGGSGRPYLLRSTPLNISSQFIALSFSMSAKAQGDATAYLSMGNGYTDSALPDSVSSSYIRFLFHLLPDGFSIRNTNQGQEGPNKYKGEQKIVLILNNSGQSQSYTAPDGTSHTVANDRFDLWVGNTIEFEGGACTNSNQVIENLKFSVLSSIAEVWLDDIEIKDLAG